MQIQLVWREISTGEQQQPLLETPIAIGRNIALMPINIDGSSVSPVVLANDQVADYHALIDVANGELIVVDQNTNTGTLINGIRLPSSTLIDGDRLQIGPYEIQLNPSTVETQGCDRQVGFLFKRRCGRTSTVGCQYCDNSNNDLSYYEYSYYSGYGRYDRGYWGSDYYYNRDRYDYDPQTGNVDFTEADNMSLEGEADADFEMDMGGS